MTRLQKHMSSAVSSITHFCGNEWYSLCVNDRKQVHQAVPTRFLGVRLPVLSTWTLKCVKCKSTDDYSPAQKLHPFPVHPPATIKLLSLCIHLISLKSNKES